MKPNNTVINKFGSVRMIVFVAAVAALSSGCRTVSIKVYPTARIQDASSQKIGLSVGLMMDNAFCTNQFIPFGGARIYPFGPALTQQSISLCEQSFEKVNVSTNGLVPAGVDAILTPTMHRCGIGYAPHSATEEITLLLQWTLRTADNRNILWMTTVDGHAKASRKEVYQLLFDDLANKSYRAFQDSAEIKRIIAK